jgi:NAD(P)H dehydrogenase (quinone)
MLRHPSRDGWLRSESVAGLRRNQWLEWIGITGCFAPDSARLDYQNPERNERLVKRHDDQLAATEALVLIYPAWWYGMPAMLKGYFDRVWLPGVAFDVAPGGNVSTERLKQLRHIMLCGSWWMVRFAMGDPAGKLIGRACAPSARAAAGSRGCVHYNMDKAVPAQLARFLQRIRTATQAPA